jgi:methanogenic corrinoid protein MtbC1
MFERLSAEPIYNTRAVVQRTGVPADTFRAWERRYGVPHPSRSSGNQRLYSERDIATINWLRDQTNSKVTISQAIALLHLQSSAGMRSDRSDVMAELGLPDRRHLQPEPSPLREIRDELIEVLIALDGTGADRIVDEALAMTSVENVCLRILQDALEEIGERWQHGSANVAIEHFATAYVQRKFGALFNHSNPNEGRGPIVAACPEGELHEIGLLLSCLFLSRRGYKILYLGANMPLEDLISTVRHVQPPLVMLSGTLEESAHKIVQSVPKLKNLGRDSGSRDLPEIGFGGYIFKHRPDLRLGIDGTYLGGDANEVVKNVDRIFALLSV